MSIFFLFSLYLFFSISGWGQTVLTERFSTAEDSLDAHLRIVLEGQAFFVNNEYAKSTRINGYTLPGFYLRPHIAWQFDSHIRLESGLHWLYFWGDHSMHDAKDQGLICSDWDSVKPPQVVPWLRLRITPTPTLTILLGSIDNNNGHHLPLPLYNPERAYATQPEAGIQLLWHKPWIDIDAWVDWQRFVWNRSSHREVFISGISAEPNIGIGASRIHLPLHIVVQHLGGENRRDTTHQVETQFNAAFGFGISRQFNEWTLRADCLAMLYARTGSPEGELNYVCNWEDWWYLSSPRRNFKHGWGFYPHITAKWHELQIEASYWISKKYVPLIGCYHYSNVSINTSDMTHNRIQVTAIHGGWMWNIAHCCSLFLFASWFHYFPFTADRTGYEKQQGKSADMFSLGLQIAFRPHLTIL